MGRSRFALSVLPFAATLSFAQTFVVDVANGPGTNYVSIAAAVAAVPDGAVLLVRPGNYGGFVISGKGLAVLGGTGVGITGPVFVDSTSPTQSVVLRGLTLNSLMLCYSAAIKIGVTNCSGPLLLEDITTPGGFLFGRCVGTPLRALNCPQLVVRNCGLAGRTEVESSTVTFEGGDLFGWIAESPNLDTSGILLLNSTVQMTDAAVRGGDGFATSTPGSPGIELQGSDLRLLAGSSVAAGTGVGLAPATVVASGTNQLRVETSVPVTGPGPQFQGVTAQLMPMPAVHVTGGTAGGSLDATVTTQVGDLVILIVGLRGAPATIPGFSDDFWLAPGTYSFLAIAVQPSASNPVTGSIAVPAMPSFAGLQLVWHAVTSGAVTGLQNSNPGISLIH